MKLSDFDFNLPSNLIATEPAKPRDHSRLLVLDKKTGKIEHKHFYDLVDYLGKGDILILNNSKVIPARLIGKKDTGGKVEVFLHKKISDNIWQCLLGAKKMKTGLKIYFEEKLEAEILKDNGDGTWNVVFSAGADAFDRILEKIGHVPLPPYIKKEENKNSDKKNYQTVYADDEKKGSVAAPTAGLHFTPDLIKKLKDKGVQIEYITLHVGLGTFAPVKVDDIEEHKMHSEYVEIKKSVAEKIIKAKREGRRVVSVGTTSTRTLESQIDISNPWPVSENLSAWVNIFIYPGYKFKVVDSIITNFHLPKSTLLMLVSAFAGKGNIDKAYKSAILEKYRFYSYGDAMLILES